eukprot:TRINITY_DN1476_c0_g2_i2.p1 TRINITY_DN1476_c0_g2~~TRINITY_DN1476_c0_g2_i2.p1  ORF type:complete len:508 (-),score=134.87 TRINITY_DN1476_c0_g2_i2:26-1549(-)
MNSITIQNSKGEHLLSLPTNSPRKTNTIISILKALCGEFNEASFSLAEKDNQGNDILHNKDTTTTELITTGLYVLSPLSNNNNEDLHIIPQQHIDEYRLSKEKSALPDEHFSLHVIERDKCCVLTKDTTNCIATYIINPTFWENHKDHHLLKVLLTDSKFGVNDVMNGLLLREDASTLFQQGLWSIQKVQEKFLAVSLDSLSEAWDGLEITFNEDNSPSEELLEFHFKLSCFSNLVQKKSAKRSSDEETSEAGPSSKKPKDVNNNNNNNNDDDDSEIAQKKEKMLNDLQTEVANNKLLPLYDPSLKVVFGRGNPNTKILFVAEFPGPTEDKTGIPFTGPAGKKLSATLEKIGLQISDIYLCNVLKYSTPEGRDPKTNEIETHGPYLAKQISIIKPWLIVTMGNLACKYVLAGYEISKMKSIKGITHIHGKVQQVNLSGVKYNVMPALHPAAVLHFDKFDPLLQEDFQHIKEFIESDQFKPPIVEGPPKKQRALTDFFGKKAKRKCSV